MDEEPQKSPKLGSLIDEKTTPEQFESIVDGLLTDKDRELLGKDAIQKLVSGLTLLHLYLNLPHLIGLLIK